MRISLTLFTALALALSIGLASAASPYASSAPDGLERVAIEKGFAERADGASAPLGGYAVPGIGNDRVAAGLAGFSGTLAVFLIGAGAAWILRRRRPESRPTARA